MRKVETRATIHTLPEAVITAFIDPAMLKGWWGVERALTDPCPGGVYTLAWNITDKGFEYVTTGVIREYDPHKKLVVENLVYLNPGRPFYGPMTLTVEATRKGQATEVCLCQDGYADGEHWDWYYEAVTLAWPKVFETLKTYLENQPPQKV